MRRTIESQRCGHRRLRPSASRIPDPDHITKSAIKANRGNRNKYTATGGIMPFARSNQRVDTSGSSLRTIRRQSAWSPFAAAFHLPRHQRAYSKMENEVIACLLGQLSGHHQVRGRGTPLIVPARPEKTDSAHQRPISRRPYRPAETQNGIVKLARPSRGGRGDGPVRSENILAAARNATSGDGRRVLLALRLRPAQPFPSPARKTAKPSIILGSVSTNICDDRLEHRLYLAPKNSLQGG